LKQEYVIYTDESIKRGVLYSNFYGGLIVHSKELDRAVLLLKGEASRQNLGCEIKWNKVTENYLDKYKGMMDLFFFLLRENRIRVRVMFTNNVYIPTALDPYHTAHAYYILYYQFIKNAFGLQYATPDKRGIKIKLFLDRLNGNYERNATFKGHISALNRSSLFRDHNIEIMRDQIIEVDSKKHILLQCLDVVLGSIQFKLNKTDKIDRGARRTYAKLQLFSHIHDHIKDIHPRFDISTNTRGGPEKSWIHPYRHWLFKPRSCKVLK